MVGAHQGSLSEENPRRIARSGKNLRRGLRPGVRGVGGRDKAKSVGMRSESLPLTEMA